MTESIDRFNKFQITIDDLQRMMQMARSTYRWRTGEMHWHLYKPCLTSWLTEVENFYSKRDRFVMSQGQSAGLIGLESPPDELFGVHVTVYDRNAHWEMLNEAAVIDHDLDGSAIVIDQNHLIKYVEKWWKSSL